MGLFTNIAGLGSSMILLVLAIGLGYIVFATFLSRWLVGARKQRASQARIKQLQQELAALAKAKGPQQDIMARQKEMMALVSASMGASFKPLVILFPLTLLIYWVLVPALSRSVAQRGIIQGLFFWILVIGGVIASVITWLWDKRQLKKELAVQVVSQPVQASDGGKGI